MLGCCTFRCCGAAHTARMVQQKSLVVLRAFCKCDLSKSAVISMCEISKLDNFLTVHLQFHIPFQIVLLLRPFVLLHVLHALPGGEWTTLHAHDNSSDSHNFALSASAAFVVFLVASRFYLLSKKSTGVSATHPQSASLLQTCLPTKSCQVFTVLLFFSSSHSCTFRRGSSRSGRGSFAPPSSSS